MIPSSSMLNDNETSATSSQCRTARPFQMRSWKVFLARRSTQYALPNGCIFVHLHRYKNMIPCFVQTHDSWASFTLQFGQLRAPIRRTRRHPDGSRHIVMMWWTQCNKPSPILPENLVGAQKPSKSRGCFSGLGQ